MENILIKRKQFVVLEQLSETTYKLSFKGKVYFGKKFDDVKVALKNYVKEVKFLASCGLNVPKLMIIDKKSGFVLSQFIEGETVLDTLMKTELSEAHYRGIFALAYRCKLEKVSINFLPENFVLVNDKLYYLSTDYNKYSEQDNFVNKYVRLWFYTTELCEHLKAKELPVDKTRLKVEYAINKEIVLTTIKYYM